MISLMRLDLLHRNEVAHRADHAADLRRVRALHRLTDLAQAQRAQREPLVLLAADAAADLGDDERQVRGGLLLGVRVDRLFRRSS
jgi:hypothetical protein